MDIEPLLAPVSATEPCGPDLKSTLAYAELDRLARGKPEQYVGDKIVAAAEEPSWRDVLRLTTALLGQTKDLRLAVTLTRGLIHTTGWAGLGDGLLLVRRLLEVFWEDVHPQLDREDADDPTLRMNSLAELAHEDAVIAPLRRQPLVSGARTGRFSLRDVQLAAAAASGRAEPGAKAVDGSLIEGAFGEADLGELQKTAALVHAAFEQAVAIERVVSEKLGAGSGVSLAKLTRLLQDTDRLMADKVAARTPAVEPERGEGGMADLATGNGATQPGAGRSPPGVIRSREDVARALDAICDYYRDREPSSPVPILLQRAKGLVAKNFFEIVQDLTPDGVSQLKLIRGKSDDD